VHCAQTAEPTGANFGTSVAPDENSTALKFGDYRFRGWVTLPPNDPAKWLNSRFFMHCGRTVQKKHVMPDTKVANEFSKKQNSLRILV